MFPVGSYIVAGSMYNEKEIYGFSHFHFFFIYTDIVTENHTGLTSILK